MKRRTVHKITPSHTSSFDQQFWPVLVALTVLSGIGLGAVLTILRGPWMWGSLLVLPLLAAVAIFLLFNLDDNRLRRSLQFAIITSLAAHLLVLVFASVVNIFENPYKPNERQVAQRPIRTIEISDQRAAFVWEETNARQTPEPTIETERQDKPTTVAQPQPVPVTESKPDINPQLVRRETTAKSVPRQNRELSKLKRQTQKLQPQSSQKVTGQKQAENKVSPAASTAQSQAESSEQADSLAQKSAPQKETVVEPDKASAPPDSTSKPVVAKSNTNPQRATPAEKPTQATPKPSPSSARVSRSTPRLPIASKQAPVADKVAKATTTQPTKSEPSKSSSELTRRPVENNTVRPAFTNLPKTELSPRSQVAKTVQRKTAPQTLPSIASKNSVTITPRRSTTESAVAASPVQKEQPARAPESKTASRELNSKTLSVSRSTEGVAGMGRAKNLDRFTGGLNSPASRASDSAKRERTKSAASDPRMLTSSQKSETRRAVGVTRIPTSAFKSETSAAAKISGAKTTSEQTLESSAASLNAASSNQRDEVSAEKGSATVDLGATKIVTDRQTSRRSGGGQPEVAQLNPESTRRSKDRSSQQPSLVASSVADVASPRSQSTAPPSNNALEASQKSIFAARESGQSPTTVERWSSDNVGQITDQGQSNLAQQLADSRQPARRASNDSSWTKEDDEEDEENQRGNQRTRVAQAPVTRSDPGFGTADNEATALAPATRNGEGPSESVAATISRQATASVPGTGIGRTASNILLQAATSLPIIEAAPNRRPGAGNAKTQPDLTAGVASKPKPRGSRSTKSSAAPTIAGSATTESPAVSNRSSTDVAKLDSAAVSISKSDLAPREQIQGSDLDIDAEEGPAGLGIRPDEFIGVLTRPASRESEQLMPDMKNRFRSDRFGGVPAVNPDAVIAQEAFRNRNPSALASASEPTTEAAIHLGLEFLARYQSPDGSWSLTGFDRDEPQHLTQLDSDTAATGLALLAFQGAGYNHREFKYARQIDQAIQWLIENQDENGGLYVQSDKKSDNACRLYSHGIAALALTEAYGMTQDVRLKEPAQKALDYIAKSQDPRKGGWRYFDQPGKKSSDTSVTGWMMMAMQSGRLAGLTVDEQSFTEINDWLEVAADPDNNSLYRYNPYAKDSKGVSRMQGRKPTASMTSVGLLMRIYGGWERDDPRLLAGADFLLDEQLPSDATPQVRDTYYWYYATQVLKHVDGPRWEKWNEKLRPLLTRSQEKSGELAGSWHPYQPVPDRWGSFGGRLYVTTMNLLSLEVRHRLLPIYRQDSETPAIESEAESIANAVSTNITPVEPARTNPRPQPVINVAKPAEPNSDLADSEMQPSTKANARSTRVKKPGNVAIRSTPVEKPDVVAPAASLRIETDSTARSVNLDPPSPTNLSPQITRNTNPLAPKRTRSNIAPSSTPAKIDPESIRPKNAETNLADAPLESMTTGITKANGIDPAAPTDAEMAKPKLDLKPATMPGEAADIKRPTIDSAMARNSTLPDGTKSGLTKRPRSQNSIANTKPSVKPLAERKPTVTEPTVSEPVEAVDYVAVSGLVTLNGKLLENAKIEFIPLDEDGSTVKAKTDRAGRFLIAAEGTKKQPGVKVGKYKVAITSFFESPDVNVIDFLERIPAKFNSKTTLRTTISADKKNALKIDLSTK